eukprot:TRINITY_DN1162_c0_g9_i2.p1 TRINITY_DN1162_c0_g9~~TRINITY_DN1162_c0_g9_i2.p1  ORF type:complete len:163 (+),score=43.93 TRINITY_DN1162_c0_g9_i2:52-489(+)
MEDGLVSGKDLDRKVKSATRIICPILLTAFFILIWEKYPGLLQQIVQPGMGDAQLIFVIVLFFLAVGIGGYLLAIVVSRMVLLGLAFHLWIKHRGRDGKKTTEDEKKKKEKEKEKEEGGDAAQDGKVAKKKQKGEPKGMKKRRKE